MHVSYKSMLEARMTAEGRHSQGSEASARANRSENGDSKIRLWLISFEVARNTSPYENFLSIKSHTWFVCWYQIQTLLHLNNHSLKGYSPLPSLTTVFMKSLRLL